MHPEYEYRPGPTKNHKRTQYTHLAEHLQNNPGVWVKVRTASTQNAAAVASYQIRTGIRAAFRPAGHYDSYTEGRDIIARYAGGK